MSDRPLYMEPLIGWRAWKGMTRPSHFLIPLTQNAAKMNGEPVWPHYKPAEASCNCCGHGVIPNFTSHFGLYAFRKVLDLYRECPHAIVIGQVYIWGRVLECGVQGFMHCMCSNKRYRTDGSSECEQHGISRIGKIVKGWRAQYAYPKHLLTLDESLVDPLSTAYGVPCEFGHLDREMNGLLAEKARTETKIGKDWPRG